jgi:hypothetical protein
MSVFKSPFTCKLVGPSGSGKTVILSEILKHRESLFDKQPDTIYYCYSRWQDVFNSMEGVKFHEGMIDLDETCSNSLIIFDDLMSEIEDDLSVLKLFTVDSHHQNKSVFFLSQNLFSKGKYSRTINLNVHYLFLFNNPRDEQQIHVFGRQMFPRNSNFLIEAYEDATSVQFGYLFLDFKQTTMRDFRVQTGVLPGQLRLVYQSKK